MRILHTVEFYYPSQGGMQTVVREISERLVKMGHDVTVVTTTLTSRKRFVINGVKIKEFNISGNYAHGINGEVQKYQNYLKNSSFDIITNFAAQQWTTDLALPILSELKAKKVFAPTGFSGLYMPEYFEYFQKMKVWMKDYDLNLFLSNKYRDIDFARENGISKIEVVPNGASEEEFLKNYPIDIRKNLGISKDNFLILHVGSHTAAKGHKEAIEIFKNSSLTNSALLIIGNNFGGGCVDYCTKEEITFNRDPKNIQDNKQLIMDLKNPFTREETVEAYKEADLFLFPSNIECSPVVLFECMAAKLPFLTTEAGNSKEIIEWSNAGQLLPTKIVNQNGNCEAEIPGSVKLLENIYNNKNLGKQLGENGFKAWEDKFSWSKITGEIERLYLGLLKEKSLKDSNVNINKVSVFFNTFFDILLNSILKLYLIKRIRYNYKSMIKNIPNKLKDKLKRFFNNRNIQIFSTNYYNNVLKQLGLRTELLLFHTNPANINVTTPPVEIVIFSMDRAIQIYSLIKSCFDYLDKEVKIHILYRSTTAHHEESYNQLIEIFKGKNINFVKQVDKSTFKPQLVNILESIQSSRMLFLVDDILIKDKISIDDITKFDPRSYILSLRLGEHLTRCYTSDKDQKLPEFISDPNVKDDKLCWVWDKGEYDWNYPLSVDGHVFSTPEILALTKYADFNTPNTFEGNIQLFREFFLKRYGICYKNSKILNLPINKVNDDTENLHGNIDTNYLLQKWNEGMQIDYKKLNKFSNISAHQEVDISFVKRD